jgi:NADH-quinone oxidoreductase subunit J
MDEIVVRIAFWAFAAVAVLSSLAVVANKNPVVSAMALVSAFLSVAGIYLTIGATFLTAVQILVYAGAIMVLFLFVIMLLNLEHDPFEGIPVRRVAAGAAVFAFLFGAAAVVLGSGAGDTPAGGSETTGEGSSIGRMFFADYVFPFEMTSLLLLIAMIGAILIARRPAPGERDVDVAEDGA